MRYVVFDLLYHTGRCLVREPLARRRVAKRGKRIQEMAAADLPKSRRKEVFRLLVVAQDYRMSVSEAREMACDLFGLVVTQVVRIEQEGLESDWPPL